MRLELDRFRKVVARLMALNLGEDQTSLLEQVLARRALARAVSVSGYLADVERWPDEIAELAAELTVGETYFFRHAEQYAAFAAVAAQHAGPRLRVLSAGCASGEEPYSLAILTREQALAAGAVIVGVDVNAVALAKARRGRYSAWALRETPPPIQQRWFAAQGGEHVLAAEVKAAVTFVQHNLARDDAELWRPGSYDVIFCRNVLMYFTPEAARAAVARMAAALMPSGHLFLGHAETLRGLSHDFHLRHSHDTFYYQRRDGLGAVVEPLATAPAPPTLVEAGWSDAWLETVQRANERIRALSERASEATRGAGAKSARDGLRNALALMEQERFAEALAQLPPEDDDADALLLRAVLLAHAGRVAEAEAGCARLLARDEMSAGAHYVLALCREGAGDVAGAEEHDRVAAYLDPSFAMPRLHLGLMARRAGAVAVAARELAQAVDLLEREDAARLLMFGGGFPRHTLIALCRGAS